MLIWCLHIRFLLALQAFVDVSLANVGSPAVACPAGCDLCCVHPKIPLELQVLESKLRSLEVFLIEAADRRRARGIKDDQTFGSAPAAGAGMGLLGGYLEDGSNRLNTMAGSGGGLFGMGPGAGVGGVRGPVGQANVQPAKRQRLQEATMVEDKRVYAIR